jgi:peptidyl-prolyl cis-trans isomerase B (cyclophilin B)
MAPAYAPPVPPQNQTNGMAIAALVCGLLAFVTGITALLAIIFGFIALSQIKKSGQQGRGMAIAGIVIGFAILILSIVGIIIAIVAFGWLVSSAGGVSGIALQGNLLAASSAQDTYFKVHDTYASSIEDLAGSGYVAPSGMRTDVAYASASTYCIESSSGTQTYHITARSLPQTGGCPLQ